MYFYLNLIQKMQILLLFQNKGGGKYNLEKENDLIKWLHIEQII